jgi:hypothetical protein
VVLEGPDLLQVENKLPELLSTYLGYVGGILSGLEEITERSECRCVNADGVFALSLGPGAEPVALYQVVKPGGPAFNFNYLVNFLMDIGCHFYPPFLSKQRVF